MKEIQDFAREYGITPRHTIRLVQELEIQDVVTKARIKGKRKRKGYTINEDNIGTLSETSSKTQKEISNFINEWRKNYRNFKVINSKDSKKLKQAKENRKNIYNWAQLVDMYQCVQLIAEIEWALRIGSLGTGKGKRDLAERNIINLETFIEEMSGDLKEHDKLTWKHILSIGIPFINYHDILGVQSNPLRFKP